MGYNCAPDTAATRWQYLVLRKTWKFCLCVCLFIHLFIVGVWRTM